MLRPLLRKLPAPDKVVSNDYDLPLIAGWSNSGYITSNRINISVAIGVLPTDLLILAVGHREPLTVPEGWTLIRMNSMPNPKDQSQSILARVAGTLAPGTVVPIIQAASARLWAKMVVVRKASGKLPVIKETSFVLGASGTSAPIPAVVDTPALVLWLVSMQFGSTGTGSTMLSNSRGGSIPEFIAGSTDHARGGVAMATMTAPGTISTVFTQYSSDGTTSATANTAIFHTMQII